MGPNLHGIVPERSDPLEPPWPELVLTAGRRNEPVARWIRQQAGGRDKVKLVQYDRQWATDNKDRLLKAWAQATGH